MWHVRGLLLICSMESSKHHTFLLPKDNVKTVIKHFGNWLLYLVRSQTMVTLWFKKHTRDHKGLLDANFVQRGLRT